MANWGTVGAIWGTVRVTVQFGGLVSPTNSLMRLALVIFYSLVCRPPVKCVWFYDGSWQTYWRQIDRSIHRLTPKNCKIFFVVLCRVGSSWQHTKSWTKLEYGKVSNFEEDFCRFTNHFPFICGTLTRTVFYDKILHFYPGLQLQCVVLGACDVWSSAHHTRSRALQRTIVSRCWKVR